MQHLLSERKIPMGSVRLIRTSGTKREAPCRGGLWGLLLSSYVRRQALSHAAGVSTPLRVLHEVVVRSCRPTPSMTSQWTSKRRATPNRHTGKPVSRRPLHRYGSRSFALVCNQNACSSVLLCMGGSEARCHRHGVDRRCDSVRVFRTSCLINNARIPDRFCVFF
jgi:hypothetical protein